MRLGGRVGEEGTYDEILMTWRMDKGLLLNPLPRMTTMMMAVIVTILL